MKFSTKTRYGIRAVLEIALNKNETGISQKDIAKNQNISYKYLDHILQSLKVAGLIVKSGGRKSGYIINKSPESITMFDIHNAFEPGICVVECLAGQTKCQMKESCVSRGFWGQLNRQIVEHFKGTSIQDLISKRLILDDFVK